MAVGTTTAPKTQAGFNPYEEQNKVLKQQNAQNQQAWQSQQPMIEGNTQANFVPLSKSAYNVNNQQMTNNQYNTTQGNNAVLGKLQQTVLNQQPSQVMPLLQQQTASYLQNPNLGYDPSSYKQMQMEQYDRQQSQAMEAARQKLGDTSQSGELQNDFLKNVMNVSQGRGDLSRKIDYDLAQQQQSNMLNALAQGRAQVATENETNTANINNLVAARGAAEGERSQTTANDQQIAVLEKTFGQDMAKLVATQDWQGAQNELDRKAAVAKQTGDIQAQKDLVTLQNQLDMTKLVATQGFDAAQADLNRKQQLAVQSNDIKAQKDIAALQNQLDMQKLVQTQGFEAAQADLDRKQQTAMQANDITAKSDLAKLQSQLDLQQLNQTQNWQSVENDINRKYDAAKQAKDIQAQSDIVQRQINLDMWKQQNGQQFTAQQNAINNALQLTLKDKDIAGQENLMKLKGAIDEGMLVKEQDWKTVEADLDRKQKDAIAKGDWQNAIDLENVKGNIQAAAQQSQQNFEAGQRIANQIFTTSERVSSEAHEQAMKYLDSQLLNVRAANDLDIAKQLKQFDAQIEEAKANNDQNRLIDLDQRRAALEETAAQNAFSRTKEGMNYQAQIDEAKAVNDFARVKELETQKAQAQETFAQSRNVEQQNLELMKYGQQLTMMDKDQLAKETLMNLQGQIDEARAQNDDRRQEYLVKLQASLDKSKLATMNEYDVQKIKLEADLEEAKAQQDEKREKLIMREKARLDWQTMEKENGYDVAMANLDAQLKSAQSKQDWKQTEMLQSEKMRVEVLEAAKDRALEQARIDLEKKGVDVQAMEDQYSLLQAEVDAGRADPQTLSDFVSGVLGKAGVKITPPDPLAEEKAAQDKYNNMVNQFIISHPQYKAQTWLQDGTGKQVTLKELQAINPAITEEWANRNFAKGDTVISEDGRSAFNEFFNNAVYGELTTEQKAEKENAGYLGSENLGNAQPGDLFNITKVTTAANGKSVPPGKYEVITNDYTKGNKVFGQTKGTSLILRNLDTNEHILIGDSKGKQKYGLLETAVDPLKFFKDTL